MCWHMGEWYLLYQISCTVLWELLQNVSGSFAYARYQVISTFYVGNRSTEKILLWLNQLSFKIWEKTDFILIWVFWSTSILFHNVNKSVSSIRHLLRTLCLAAHLLGLAWPPSPLQDPAAAPMSLSATAKQKYGGGGEVYTNPLLQDVFLLSSTTLSPLTTAFKINA